MTKTLILTLAVAIALAAPPFNRAQAQEGGKPLTPEQELKALDLSWHQAVAARDEEALGRLLADDYYLNLEGERATVSGILSTRPDGGDKNSRRRYFYTRTFVSRDGRRQVLTSRLVSL